MRLRLKYKILLLCAVVSICILAIIGGLLSSKLEDISSNTIAAGFKSQLAHINFAPGHLATSFNY